jgi:hypothetical protein
MPKKKALPAKRSAQGAANTTHRHSKRGAVRYEIAIEGSARRVTRVQVERTEKKHGVRIPAEYKEFLLCHNGGHPKRCCFSYGKVPYGDSLVASFFAVDGPAYMNLAHVVKSYAARLPVDLFPVANDPGGNLILISCARREKGAVYFWDHEAEGKKNVHRIAGSFDAFLAMLTEEKDDDFDWVPVRVSYKDGTTDTLPSNIKLMSLDRRGLVDILKLKPKETIEFFGERRIVVSVERQT